MKKEKKLIIFDLDGTLCDTLLDLTSAVNYSLSKHNLPLKNVDFVRNAIGNGVEVLISRCIEDGFDNDNYNEILTDFKVYYLNNYKNKTIPYSGVKETLIKLKNKGYLLAVCTNKLHEAALDIINDFFKDIFDMVLGSIPSLKKKPSPVMIEYILNKLNIKKDETIYIGDTNVDYEVAINSGVDFILVSYGYRKKDQLIALDKRSLIIDDIRDLLVHI